MSEPDDLHRRPTVPVPPVRGRPSLASRAVRAAASPELSPEEQAAVDRVGTAVGLPPGVVSAFERLARSLGGPLIMALAFFAALFWKDKATSEEMGKVRAEHAAAQTKLLESASADRERFLRTLERLSDKQESSLDKLGTRIERLMPTGGGKK